MARWLARLAAGALLLAALPAPARAQSEEDAAAARKVFEALKGEDPDALGALVDFDRRSAERVARYQQAQTWSAMAEDERAILKENLLLDWIEWAPEFNRRAQVFQVQAIRDPDAGQGAVPDRRILRLLMRNVYTGTMCDILITLTPDRRLLDIDQGEPYAAGDNPDGVDGRLPRPFFTAPPPDIGSWPPLPDDQPDHRDATAMVDALLAAAPGPALAEARGRLHKYPRPCVAALVERLATIDAQPAPDAPQQALIGIVLQQITGHGQTWWPYQPASMDEATWRATNRANVRDWCRWHAAQGWIFEAQPVPASALLAVAPVPGPPAAGKRPPPPAPGPAGAPPATPPVASAPPASAPAGAAPPANTARGTKRELLFPAAADLPLRFQGRPATGREVESSLAPSVKEALNDWADICTKLKLTVVTTGSSDFLVIGGAPEESLDAAAKWITEALELLDPVVPVVEGREPKTIVAVLFDQPTTKTPTWGSLLDDLVRRRVLLDTTAAEMRTAPAGLLRRQAPLFLQPVFDLGEAIDGGGEFQLGNEVVGKLTQCLVTQRCGELPRGILWGLDYVVEMQMFATVYQFDSEGFMATADHFDWPTRTKQALAKAMKARDFSLGALAARDADAAKPTDAQMITWAALEWMRREQPEGLGKLLVDLAALQTVTGPRYATAWTPEPEPTVKATRDTLDAVDAKAVHAWLDAM
jgi:hypothetical protein